MLPWKDDGATLGSLTRLMAASRRAMDCLGGRQKLAEKNEKILIKMGQMCFFWCLGVYLFTICHTVYIIFFGLLIFAVYGKPVQTFGMAHWVVFCPSLIIYNFLRWETGQLGMAAVPADTGVGCLFQYSPKKSVMAWQAGKQSIFPKSANFRSQQFGGSTILLQLFVVPQHTPNTKGHPPTVL